MNLNIPKINTNIPRVSFKRDDDKKFYQPRLKPQPPSKDTFELSVGYVNDTHGQTNNMMRILSGIKGDLKLSGGDNDIGDEKNKTIHKATVKFLNIADITATAFGNHELDTSQADFVDTMKAMKTRVLAANFRKDDNWEQLEDNLEEYGRAGIDKELEGSMIVEVNGEKIGLVGSCPIDMFDRTTHPNYHKDCIVDNLEDTIDDIQDEVDDLREKGINKIFLLSHLGFKRDKYVAEKTTGIDVIIGGHTHELIRDIKEGENLFYSKEGEPIIITQAGRDGSYFGQLNLTFDKNGVITKAQNNIGESRIFHKNMINQYVFDEILGKPETVGFIRKAPPPPKSLIEENPHANFVCDVMRERTNSDIGLWQHSGVRNFFHEGVIDSRDVKDIAPYLDLIVVANVPEKTIVDMFKAAIKTTCASQIHKPGLLAVSGLNYTVNPNSGELVAMNFIDKNGNEIPIDVQNPSEEKTYKVVSDEFLMSAGADFNVLAEEDEYIEKYDYDKDVMVCQYLKEKQRVVDIDQVGRIKFIND